MDPSPETTELLATEDAEKALTGSRKPYTTQASNRFPVYRVDVKCREELDSNDHNTIIVYYK